MFSGCCGLRHALVRSVIFRTWTAGIQRPIICGLGARSYEVWYVHVNALLVNLPAAKVEYWRYDEYNNSHYEGNWTEKQEEKCGKHDAAQSLPKASLKNFPDYTLWTMNLPLGQICCAFACELFSFAFSFFIVIWKSLISDNLAIIIFIPIGKTPISNTSPHSQHQPVLQT